MRLHAASPYPRRRSLPRQRRASPPAQPIAPPKWNGRCPHRALRLRPHHRRHLSSRASSRSDRAVSCVRDRATSRRPFPPAPPRRLVPAKPSPRNRGQNQPARSDREDLQMADGASRRTRLPFLRREGESRAFPIASSIAVAPIRPSCRAAPAARRRHCPSVDRASAKAAVSR
jgi:hypothetical protein